MCVECKIGGPCLTKGPSRSSLHLPILTNTLLIQDDRDGRDDRLGLVGLGALCRRIGGPVAEGARGVPTLPHVYQVRTSLKYISRYEKMACGCMCCCTRKCSAQFSGHVSMLRRLMISRLPSEPLPLGSIRSVAWLTMIKG